ncbi:hypothetical protein HNQ36_004985 [Afipia massiliensis]|uniref:Uncharacterized protein n=1 Tax=Afipia massiliensis TaxID=211460 RepID=A0A840N8U4_9BRAD|nr:hypothetical protein [Afipia massiliensis]MBB5054974.1 hypothetical protein [Afipia massiliensis]
MTISEIELKALMLSSLDGDLTSYRALLERLSRRAYYKGKLAGIGKGAAEAEGSGSGSGVGDQHQATYL